MKTLLCLSVILAFADYGLSLNCTGYNGEVLPSYKTYSIKCPDQHQCYYKHYFKRFNPSEMLVNKGCIPEIHAENYCYRERENQDFRRENITVCSVCNYDNCNYGTTIGPQMSVYIFTTLGLLLVLKLLK